jgi:hypothetical protein
MRTLTMGQPIATADVGAPATASGVAGDPSRRSLLQDHSNHTDIRRMVHEAATDRHRRAHVA